jgi:PAS domain S-box-containing protein
LAKAKPKKAKPAAKARRIQVKKATKARNRRKNPHALLLDAVENVRDYAIFVMDTGGNILTWNSGAARIKGYSEEEIVGKNFRTFYLPEDIARNHPEFELKKAAEVGRYEEEGWRKRKDGSVFWASIVITKLTDRKGKLVGFSKVTRDLTARKEMEEQLRISEERFRLLVRSVKDYAIFMLDTDGRVVSWNEGATKIKGYQAEEIIGKHFSVFYPPEDSASGKWENELREAERVGRFEDEGWRVRKDGTRFWANVIVSAIRDDFGRLLGFSKVTRDLSERKRAEDRLQKSYSDLERRVKERTHELSLANEALEVRKEELKEAVRVRDEFLSIASHELKTPITSLKMQLQMLKRKTHPEQGVLPDPERLAKGLDTSLRQVERLTKLVEDLLDVARAQARKVSFRMEKTELQRVIEDAVERLQPQIEAAGNTVEMDLGPVAGEFDPFRLDQVLVNLITNALKYAPGTKIQIHTSALGNMATLIVKDEGPGIPADSASRLFERFERGSNSENIMGLGLGLFITRQIVEGHSGSIRAESEEGRGTSFIVRLPLRQPSLAEVRE